MPLCCLSASLKAIGMWPLHTAASQLSQEGGLSKLVYVCPLTGQICSAIAAVECTLRICWQLQPTEESASLHGEPGVAGKAGSSGLNDLQLFWLSSVDQLLLKKLMGAPALLWLPIVLSLSALGDSGCSARAALASRQVTVKKSAGHRNQVERNTQLCCSSESCWQWICVVPQSWRGPAHMLLAELCGSIPWAAFCMRDNLDLSARYTGALALRTLFSFIDAGIEFTAYVTFLFYLFVVSQCAGYMSLLDYGCDTTCLLDSGSDK
eukprot:scaffold57948_cov19-Tisochrysis_lutea.AAC.4